MIGVYFESWSSKFYTKPHLTDLAQIDPRINIVYIAFVDPCRQYCSQQLSSTGLEFCQDFQIIKDAIKILTDRKVKVMLSVGGSDYHWKNYNTSSIKLARDLGCSGIDIDWEPADGNQSSSQLWKIISDFSKPDLLLSLACWSSGAYEPTLSDQFSGMNISGIRTIGYKLDWLNIMSYDTDESYKPLDALKAYRKIYRGPINLGCEIGKPGWGPTLLTTDMIWTMCLGLKAESNKNGIFFWSLQSIGKPSCMEGVGESFEAFK